MPSQQGGEWLHTLMIVALEVRGNVEICMDIGDLTRVKWFTVFDVAVLRRSEFGMCEERTKLELS